MTEYDPYLSCPVAFRSKTPDLTLGSVVSNLDLKQFHCAETEKYPHVTYFINGGREEPYPGEKRVLIPSPNVATYDLSPEMSCKEVSEEVIRAINDDDYKLIIVNFANGDMVGHTAIKDAIVKAMEALDEVLGEVVCAAIGSGHLGHRIVLVLVDGSPWRRRDGLAPMGATACSKERRHDGRTGRDRRTRRGAQERQNQTGQARTGAHRTAAAATGAQRSGAPRAADSPVQRSHHG